MGRLAERDQCGSGSRQHGARSLRSFLRRWCGPRKCRMASIRCVLSLCASALGMLRSDYANTRKNGRQPQCASRLQDAPVAQCAQAGYRRHSGTSPDALKIAFCTLGRLVHCFIASLPWEKRNEREQEGSHRPHRPATCAQEAVHPDPAFATSSTRASLHPVVNRRVKAIGSAHISNLGGV